MDHQLLVDCIKLLFIATMIVAICHRLGLSPLLGYLLSGVFLGPFVLNWLEHSYILSLLGEIGVTFLLFSIGLEFSFATLMKMRNIFFGLGFVQVALGTLSGALIAAWIGIPWQGALIIGGALALSSSALIIKMLSDNNQVFTEHGKVSVGILLFQDLAAIPFLILIPILAASETEGLFEQLGLAMVSAFAVIVFILLIGRFLISPLFDRLARSGSEEVFTLLVLLVVLAAAWVSQLAGLSLALGAFIAGMILSGGQSSKEIAAEIRPFKDILLGLFFIIVGMQLNLSSLLIYGHWIALLVCGLVIGKGGLVFLLARAGGFGRETSFRAGAALGQGGEFSIALLTLALAANLISDRQLQPVLGAIVFSMAIAPLILGRITLKNR